MNGSSETVSTEQCKRAHEDDGEEQETQKKQCLDSSTSEAPTRVKKKKFAMLIGYNGKDYHGMQINKSFKTIESELLEALHKAGLIQESESKEPYLIKFQRAARTDKTVSAVQQVVSLMMPIEFKLEDINAHLSPNVRIFSVKRVTKGFDSKGHCSSRTYSYVLPTQVLTEEPLDSVDDTYRISPELIKKLDDILSLYTGTHNFHNFTSKRHHSDPSAKRFIMSFKCGEPFVRGKEFIILTVKGQSFMLHQIRKMVGTVVAIMRGMATPDIIKTARKSDKIRVPEAPGQGLLLEQPHFDKYNVKYGNDGIHDALTWDDVQEEIQRFREETVIAPIIEDELANQTMVNWVKENLIERKFSFQPANGDEETEAKKSAAEPERAAEEQ